MSKNVERIESKRTQHTRTSRFSGDTRENEVGVVVSFLLQRGGSLTEQLKGEGGYLARSSRDITAAGS